MLGVLYFYLLSNSEGLEKNVNTVAWITSFILVATVVKRRGLTLHMYMYIYICRSMELKNTDEVEKEISSFSACTEMSKY